jgi:Nucleotide-diphospho-sugar transferase
MGSAMHRDREKICYAAIKSDIVNEALFMKIFCVVTPSHKILYERFFLPSLDTESFDLHSSFLDQEGSGDFLADDFKNCIRFKLTKIIESIQNHPDATIVWSDVDLQFFGLEPSHISSYFEPDFDFVAQRLTYRDTHVCGGFYAIRCSGQTLAFFRQVEELTLSTTDGNEQDAINLVLNSGSPKFKWQFFGREFYARTHGIAIPINAVLHHATGLVEGNGVQQKIFLLRQLEHFEKWSNIRRRLFVLQQAPASLKRKLSASRRFGQP